MGYQDGDLSRPSLMSRETGPESRGSMGVAVGDAYNAAIAGIPATDTAGRVNALASKIGLAGLPHAVEMGLIPAASIAHLGDQIAQAQSVQSDKRHRADATGLAVVGGVVGGGLLAGAEAAGAGASTAGASTAGAGATAMPAAVADTTVLGAGSAAGAGVAAGSTLMPPAIVDTAALTGGGAAAAGTGAAAVGTQEATGAEVAPGTPATPQMPPAQPEVGVGGAAKTGGALATIKEYAPAVQAGLTALGLGASLAAGSPGDMGGMEAPTPPDLPVEADIQKQNAIDPDLTAIRKKNALLFGLDSPSNTDLTKGNASTGNLGRVTLLGGTSSLG